MEARIKRMAMEDKIILTLGFWGGVEITKGGSSAGGGDGGIGSAELAGRVGVIGSVGKGGGGG